MSANPAEADELLIPIKIAASVERDSILKGVTSLNNENMQASVSKTLFIPLAARASEMKRSNPIVRDEKANEIISQIETGEISVDGGEIATLGVLARTRVIDDEIKRILLDKPNTTIINLGAGHTDMQNRQWPAKML